MPLSARHREDAVERAAPADLDRVAELAHVRWLAQDAMVEFLPARGGPGHELHGAIGRGTCFVTGDQKRVRAFRLAAMCCQVIERGGDRAGDAALHVDGAAAVK